MKLKCSLFAATLALVAMLASVSNAASIAYKLFQDADGPGTFRLTAQASNGDNSGLASFGVVLTGITTAKNMSPFTTDLNTFSQVGFNLLRSSDAASSLGTITGSQDTINAGSHILYGLGQTAGTWAGNGILPGGPAGSTRPDTTGWGTPLLIATGTYPIGGTPGFNTQSPDFATNTFLNSTGTGVSAASATAQVIPAVPEPATIAMAGLALVGMVGASRRRA